jgi:hypothetical protein
VTKHGIRLAIEQNVNCNVVLIDVNDKNMKTDLVEIFQTIRASLQPYAVLGFTNRLNTEETYDLWSDKNVKEGSEIHTEAFFASIHIKNDYVLLATGFNEEQLGRESSKQIKELDDALMNEIEETFATGYRLFKEKEWV